MSTSNIRDLAIKFGAMETISNAKNNPLRKPQEFDYLIVLDFEATCWSSKPMGKIQNEIIEFSAVLLDLDQAEIVNQFQMYVKPTEHPDLSDFCINLTGISQATVDNASCLEDVLVAFDSWLDDMKKLHGIECFGSRYARGVISWCAFATWSDWDLGTCLKKECQRKWLKKEEYFNQWIDVRKTYVDFYKERPMGLLGALHSQNMHFVGVEHCGLDDAKNTAYLINAMIRDGVNLNITKVI